MVHNRLYLVKSLILQLVTAIIETLRVWFTKGKLTLPVHSCDAHLLIHYCSWVFIKLHTVMLNERTMGCRLAVGFYEQINWWGKAIVNHCIKMLLCLSLDFSMNIIWIVFHCKSFQEAHSLLLGVALMWSLEWISQKLVQTKKNASAIKRGSCIWVCRGSGWFW